MINPLEFSEREEVVNMSFIEIKGLSKIFLQGPIGRYDRLGKQLYSGHSFNLKNVEYGLQRIGWGLFKKVVIADRAAVLVLNVFNNYEAYSGFHYIMAVLLYDIPFP